MMTAAGGVRPGGAVGLTRYFLRGGGVGASAVTDFGMPTVSPRVGWGGWSCRYRRRRPISMARQTSPIMSPAEGTDDGAADDAVRSRHRRSAW